MKIQNKMTGRADQKSCEFNSIERSGEFAIYSRTDKNGTKHFEVIHIQTQKKDWIMGGKLVAKKGDESYPSSATWGTSGWTYKKMEGAKKKFDNLVETHKVADNV